LHIAQPVGTLPRNSAVDYPTCLSYFPQRSFISGSSWCYHLAPALLPQISHLPTNNLHLLVPKRLPYLHPSSYQPPLRLGPPYRTRTRYCALSIGSSVGRQPRTDLADRGPGPFKHYGRPRCHCTSCPTRVNCSSANSVVIGPLAPYVCIAWGVGDKKVALVSGPRWTPASHYPGHRCCRYWASGIYTHTHILGAI
jgi:hypothetical protein